MKNQIKKSLVFLMSLAIVFSSSAFPASALSNNENFVVEECQNPFYAGREVYYASLDSLDTSESSIAKKYKSHTYYSDGIELYKAFKAHLTKRETDFQIHYLSKSKIFLENVLKVVEKIYINATEEAISENPVDGDYIRWVVSSLGIKRYSDSRFFNEEYIDGYYCYTLDLRFSYYDTAKQEAEVDKVVEGFVSSVDTNTLTDYEIIKKIHDFISSKTTYDFDAVDSPEGREYAATAYGALVKGKCVCQGYAVAFYRLCKELGYSCRFVSSDSTWGCHAWNIVGLDGKYYFVDTTWDDGYLDEGRPDEAYTYFLVNYDTLRKNDSYRSEHIPESKFYDNEYFIENYQNHLDSQNYDKDNKNLLSQHRISLSKSSFVYSGNSYKPEFEISNSESVPEFKVAYSNNKNTGIASVDFLSEDSTVILSHRNFIILPDTMTSLSLAENGRAVNEVSLKWNKAAGRISGYEIDIYENGKWSKVKTLSSSSTSVKISSLKPATIYKFRIRSYKNFGSRDFFGANSKTYITATKPKQTKLSSLLTKSNSITVKWKKVSCSGYEIQYADNKSMKNAKTVTASSSMLSKKIKKLKKGKKYYFRIRAYKKYTSASGKSCRCYSSWSAKKSTVCR